MITINEEKLMKQLWRYEDNAKTAITTGQYEKVDYWLGLASMVREDLNLVREGK